MQLELGYGLREDFNMENDLNKAWEKFTISVCEALRIPKIVRRLDKFLRRFDMETSEEYIKMCKGRGGHAMAKCSDCKFEGWIHPDACYGTNNPNTGRTIADKHRKNKDGDCKDFEPKRSWFLFAWFKRKVGGKL